MSLMQEYGIAVSESPNNQIYSNIIEGASFKEYAW